MKTNKPKVGDVLYSVNVGNAARNREQVATPVVVISVGRKFFVTCELGQETNRYRHTKYSLKDWREVTDYTPDSQLYESEQEFLNEKIARRIWDKLRRFFASCNNGNISLEDLKEIEAIIEPKGPVA